MHFIANVVGEHLIIYFLIKLFCAHFVDIDIYVVFSILQDLQKLVDILRLTHELLSEHVKMDPYPLMMGEMTETISLVSFSGRMATQVVKLAFFVLFFYNAWKPQTGNACVHLSVAHNHLSQKAVH